MSLSRDFVNWEYEVGDRAAFALNWAWLRESQPDVVRFKLLEYSARGGNFHPVIGKDRR